MYVGCIISVRCLLSVNYGIYCGCEKTRKKERTCTKFHPILNLIDRPSYNKPQLIVFVSKSKVVMM